MARLSDFTNQLSAFAQQRSFSRAVVAMGRGTEPHMAERIARELWPNDKDALSIVQKGAVVPTSTTGTTQFNETNIETLGTVLGPADASANVFARALGVSLGRANGLKVPSATAAPDTIFVGEASPAKVKQYSFSDGVTLLPKKTVFITTATREIIEHSNADAVIRDLIARNFGLSLASILFGSAASSSTTPAGILNGLSTVGATAGGGDNALVMDLGKLASAVGGLSGGFDDLVFVGGPSAAMKVAARLPMFKYPVFASGAVADDTLICLSPSCLAVAGGTDAPQIEVRNEPALHMEDANPAAFSTVGTPNVVAAPIRSLFQTDTVAIRLRASIDWGLRGGGAAFVSSVTW